MRMLSSQVNKAQVWNPATLADWLMRVPGGVSPRELRYGYFGPGSGLLQKDITGAGDTFTQGDFFTNTYGAKVWDTLNSQTRFFNLMRKVAWGPTTGYRIRSGRNVSTQPVSETGALPDIDSPDLQKIYVQPVFIVTAIGVSALAQFLGTLEGGIGDALAVAQETSMIDHTKRLNQMLLASATQRVVAGGAGTSTLANAAWVSVGDVMEGTSIVGTFTILTVNYDTNVITHTGTLTTDEVIFTSARSGFASIDDIVECTGRYPSGVTMGASQAANYGSLTAVGADRDPLTWSAGLVYEAAGVLRHLTTGLVDQPIDGVRRAGGEPDLILTGIEQITRLGTILQANQHFIGEGTFQVKLGGEGTLKGYPTGFQVATYKGIPMFHDFDVATAVQLAGASPDNDAMRGGNLYVLDTRFLEVPVLFTTQYMESRDYLQNNMLGIKAIYLTAGNLRCLDFRKQAKVVDLSDGVNLS